MKQDLEALLKRLQACHAQLLKCISAHKLRIAQLELERDELKQECDEFKRQRLMIQSEGGFDDD